MIDFWDIAEVFAVLGILVLVFYFSIKFMRKYLLNPFAQGKSRIPIEVLQVQSVVPKKFIGVVKVNDQHYLLGISDMGMTLIDKLDSEDIPQQPETEDKKSFFEYFKENLGVTK